MSDSGGQRHWRRSSFCSEGTCVEVARDGGMFLVRNSEQPDIVVRFTAAEWEAFRLGMKNEEF